jgi:hypothetical protein
MGMLFL